MAILTVKMASPGLLAFEYILELLKDEWNTAELSFCWLLRIVLGGCYFGPGLPGR